MRLSIVIPTLNESKYLGKSISSIHQNFLFKCPEIIVADCSSQDGTPLIAQRLGAKVIQGDPPWNSRASALNHGANEAIGDVVLFLHADSEVPAGFDQRIHYVLQNPNVIGGAFQFGLDGNSLLLRFVEMINKFRYRVWPTFYGDQGIFVRKSVFNDVDGFPHRKILEDAHFCRLLQNQGKLVLINQIMMTSPRRFIQGGILRVLAMDLMIWGLDELGFDPSFFARKYQEDNRRRK